MMIASTSRNPAAANNPIPVPPAFTLTLSSDFASLISLEMMLEMSRWASATSRPMVGSSLFTSSRDMRVSPWFRLADQSARDSTRLARVGGSTSGLFVLGGRVGIGPRDGTDPLVHPVAPDQDRGTAQRRDQ